MSSLQNSLALVGGLTLVGVVLYNFWTARQNAPRQADPENLAKEPGLREADASPSGPQDPAFFEDALDALPTPERSHLWMHLIDVIAPIEVDAAVSGDAALAALASNASCRNQAFCR